MPRVQCVSVIVPVKNEADSILILLAALEGQSRRPDEIVIADGGSTDGTQNLIQEWSAGSLIKTKLVHVTGGLPGRNRNAAVEAAEYEWIAAIDAGIHPAKNWLESLIDIAEQHREARVVFGRYAPLTETHFARVAAITYVGPSDVDRRSIATCLVQKSVWRQIGGCPEDLRSSEDLLFFRRLDEHQVPVAYCRAEPVHWDLQPTFGKTFHRFAIYSQNSMRAGLFDDWQRSVSIQYVLLTTLIVAAVWWSRWMWLAVVGFVLARSLRRIRVWHHSSSRRHRVMAMLDVRTICGVALLNFVIDMAMFVGMGRWVMEDVRQSPRSRRRSQTESGMKVQEKITA